MNIFVLDMNPRLAAQYHNNRHVSKMILETAQILSTAHYFLDGARTAEKRVPGLLKPTHINHPCVAWARTSSGSYDWLHSLWTGLIEEFGLRFARGHVYGETGIVDALRTRPLNITMCERQPFAQAMPLQYRRADPVRAYRLYYFYEKAHIAQWTGPNGTPLWWDRLGVSEIRWLMRKQLAAKAVTQEQIKEAS
jgi:hypothetical protein